MQEKVEVTPEFQELYDKIDKQTKDLANGILQHVSKNDIRLLKKINNRLATLINEISEIK